MGDVVILLGLGVFGAWVMLGFKRDLEGALWVFGWSVIVALAVFFLTKR